MVVTIESRDGLMDVRDSWMERSGAGPIDQPTGIAPRFFLSSSSGPQYNPDGINSRVHCGSHVQHTGIKGVSRS